MSIDGVQEYNELTRVTSGSCNHKDPSGVGECEGEREDTERVTGEDVQPEELPDEHGVIRNEESCHLLEEGIFTYIDDTEKKSCISSNTDDIGLAAGSGKKESEKRTEDKSTGDNTSSEERSRCWNVGLFILDNLISALIVGPLNVCFWRGVWEPMERHFLPDNLVLHGLVCSVLGNMGILAACFGQTVLTKRLASNNAVIRWLVHFCYTYMIGVLNVTQWQGVWILLDGCTGLNIDSAWISFIFGYCLLAAFRCLKSAHGPPMYVLVDTDLDFYHHTTRFGTKPGRSITYFLDCILTVCVIQQLIVVYWWGTWLLLDHYVYPHDYHHSALLTVIGSFILQVIVCALQPLLNLAYRHSSGAMQRIVLEAILFSLANLVAMSHWRGVWMLVEIYVLPDRHNLSCALTQMVAMVVLSLMLCGQSVTSKGCDVDGDSTPLEGCLCPNKYIRYFVEKRRQTVKIEVSDSLNPRTV